MRRLAAALAGAVALACAGVAGADTFAVLPTAPLSAASAEVPNRPGSLVVPAALSTPPAVPQQLSSPQLQELWQRAGAQYDIPWQVLAAINKVESNLGHNMGPSSAGAIGWMQFMPDTWLRWGMDASGDGVADPWNPDDAVYSAARYLAAAGGTSDISRAVYAYNHAQWYVDEVLQLAHVYSGGAQLEAGLGDLLQQVDDAKAAVASATDALAKAAADEQRVVDAENELLARAQDAKLLSDELSFQKAAADVDAQRQLAHTLVEQRQAELAGAKAALEQAQSASASAALDPPARTLLSGASYDASGYVFPVGGGAALVSVSHTHHDYPAADIAAPEGSPLYALANGVVESAWQDDPRCGTGFTLRTEDGRSWTYCHLSYLDPSVTAGAVLAAGASVGRVGQTGDATGPHLHLQLHPASSYPQDEEWFRSFAGTAFSWQDGDAAPVTQPGSVFAVVPDAPAAEPAPDDGVVLFTR